MGCGPTRRRPPQIVDPRYEVDSRVSKTPIGPLTNVGPQPNRGYFGRFGASWAARGRIQAVRGGSRWQARPASAGGGPLRPGGYHPNRGVLGIGR